MRHNYKPQERDYSCGPAALRNCLIHFGYSITEKTIRKVCEANKEGTDEEGMYNGCFHFGFDPIELYSISPEVFKRKIIKGLKQGKVYIVSVEDGNHWISALEYKGRKIKIVDSDYRRFGKSIVQYLTSNQLINTSFCYDKFNKKKTFYAIELTLK